MPVSVGVNPPKTPVTEGSTDIAAATLPNICKMPGPPAPFIPTPLPNIGQSSDRLASATTSVKIEGKKVAIKGAYYMSQPSPDIASQGTGGGVVSSQVQGKTEFVAPGSMNVKAEGKNIQLLGDAMTNNGGSPSNAATMPGNIQPPSPPGLPPFESGIDCEKNKKPESEGGKGWDDCDEKQLCAKVKSMNKMAKQGKLAKQPPFRNKHPDYNATKSKYLSVFSTATGAGTIMSEAWLDKQFYHPCAKERWEKNGRNPEPNQKSLGRGAFQPDHVHDSQLGGNLKDITNFRMLSQSVNGAIGPSLSGYDPAKHGEITLPKCNCS